jgi:hypothetical protein
MLNLRNRDNGDGRRVEVKDVLDSNLDAYRRVFNLEKDWVSTFQESIKPDEQANKQTIETSQKESEKVSEILTEKINLLTQYNTKFEIKSTKYDYIYQVKTLNDIINNQDFIRFYNDIIRTYINPENSQQTKEEIKNNIVSLSPLINNIVFQFEILINSSALSYRTKEEDFSILTGGELDGFDANFRKEYLLQYQFISSYLNNILKSYSIYLFVQKSLFRNQLNIIQVNDVNNEYSSVIGELSSDANTEEILDEINKDDIANISQKDALEKRQQLIREDQGLPLSPEQISKLRNTMFGLPDRRAPFTAEELAEIDRSLREMAFFSEERQKEIEDRTTQAENRVAIGLPPVDVEPEIPAPYYGEYDKTDIQSNINKIVSDYRQQIISRLKETQNDVNLLTPAPLRDSIKAFRNNKYKIYSDFYESLYDKKPETENSIVERRAFPLRDYNIITNNATMKNSNAKIRALKINLGNLVNYYLSLINTETDNILRTQYMPEPIIGQGKPRFSAFFNPLYYNDENNDDYLIR